MDVAEFSTFLASKAMKESTAHPIDRYFLKPFLSKIRSLNNEDFLVYNLETGSSLYVTYLMLCLPEVWSEITGERLVKILDRLSNISSFFTIILFTYKFLEIDITDIILNLKKFSDGERMEIRNFLKRQYNNFLKTDTDIFFFEKNVYGVGPDDFLYIRQVLLIDERIKPALKSINELRRKFS